VWKKGKTAQDVFLSGAQVKLRPFIESPGKVMTETVPLFPNGKFIKGVSESLQGGTLTFTAKYTPREGALDPIREGAVEMTVLRASGLKLPTRPIRDSGEVPSDGALRLSLKMLLAYVIAGFVFYYGYMAGNLDAFDLQNSTMLQNLKDQEGEWNAINSFVFIVTTFTTIGYGDQPSMTRTLPPCEYPSEKLKQDNPFSVLLPPDLRGDVPSVGLSSSLAKDININRGTPVTLPWGPLDTSCFAADGPSKNPECLFIAVKTEIVAWSPTGQVWQSFETDKPDQAVRNVTYRSVGMREDLLVA
jgi:hypothetical protein